MKAVFGQDKHTLKAKEHCQFKGCECPERHQCHPCVQRAANETSTKKSKVWAVLTRQRQKDEPVEPRTHRTVPSLPPEIPQAAGGNRRVMDRTHGCARRQKTEMDEVF
jgi:hypothetical protein